METSFLTFESLLPDGCPIGIVPIGLEVANIGGGSVAGAVVIVGFNTVGSGMVGYWPEVLLDGVGVRGGNGSIWIGGGVEGCGVGRSVFGSTGSGAGSDAILYGLTWFDGTDAGDPTGLGDDGFAVGDTMESIMKMSLSMRKKFDFRLFAARTSRLEQPAAWHPRENILPTLSIKESLDIPSS